METLLSGETKINTIQNPGVITRAAFFIWENQKWTWTWKLLKMLLLFSLTAVFWKHRWSTTSNKFNFTDLILNVFLPPNMMQCKTKTHSTDISFLFTPLQLLHATHKIVALPPTRFHFKHWNVWFFICADKFVAVLMPYKIYKMSLHILN